MVAEGNVQADSQGEVYKNFGTSGGQGSISVLETTKELVLSINKRCEETWMAIMKEGLVIHHPHQDLFNTITKVVDDVCDGATDESSFRECLRAAYISAALLGVDKRGVRICEIVHRLLTEELTKPEDELRERISAAINAAITRLGLKPEDKDALLRKVIKETSDGEPYVSMILDAIVAMTKRRMRPMDFKNYVFGVNLDEFNNKIIVHMILPKAMGDTDKESESFDLVIDLRKLGEAHLKFKDVTHWVTDLARPPVPPIKGSGKNAFMAIGNFVVTIPAFLLPWIDRFLRAGWMPDGTTPEFYDAIKDKIETIKMPEERFRDALAEMFVKYHWVFVGKDEAGGCILKNEVSVKEWQGYTYFNTEDGEIWLPYPMWIKLRKQLEGARITKKAIRGIIKDSRTTRRVKTCGRERSIEMKNLVILDEAKVEEVLGGSIEHFVVHKEPECEDMGDNP
jgi:hypothetical protein